MRSQRRRQGSAVLELLAGLAMASAAALLAAAHQAGAGGGSASASSGEAVSVVLEPAAPVALPDAPAEPPIAPLGPAFDDDASLPAHAALVSQTTLRARLDDAGHTVRAEGAISWRNRSREPANELYLHLYLNAFKNDRTVFLRSRLGEGRGSSVPTDWGYIDVKSLRLVRQGGEPVDLWAGADRSTPGDPEDQTDIRVPLPEPCPPGGELRLEVSFESKLPTITERTGYHGSFHMVAQWFPKIARRTAAGEWRHFPFHRLSEFDADYGSYDVTLDVPASHAVGATGERVEHRVEGGRAVSRYVQSDVIDFAWASWDRFHEVTAEREGVTIRLLAPPGHEPVAAREIDAAALALRCYGRRFGRYPYPGLTIVHPPQGAEEAGGMEYPTLITTGGPWMAVPAVRFEEALTVHELGHQTFMGLVATDEHRFPFLDEGLNSYAEGACLGEAYGPGSAVDLAGLRVQMEAVHREGALGAGQDEVVARPSPGFATARHYGRAVYSRTAALVRTLGGAFGRDAVDRALGRYARAYRFQHPDPRHLLSAFEEVGGPELREALRVGLYERGWADYAVVDVSSSKHASPGGVFDRPSGRETVSGAPEAGRHDGWAVVVRRGNLRLPVDIELGFDDGSTKRVRWDGASEWVRVSCSGPSELRRVVVDPDGLIELDERFSNNALSRGGRKGSPWALERLWYALGLAAYWVSP